MEKLNYTIESLKTKFYLTIGLFLSVVGVELYLVLDNEGNTSIVFRLAMIALFIIVIIRYFGMPKQIRVEDDLVFFTSWYGKEKAAYIKDFRKIVKRMGNTTIFTEDKIIRLVTGFEDFKKFCDDVQKINPKVEVIGVK